MTWSDNVNGLYEALGGFFILLHILKVARDKSVKGVSITATAFFASWGLWNLYYYPSLGQWASFAGGLFVVTANLVWVYLLLKYRRG